MAAENINIDVKSIDENLKKSFLNVYQTLQFSKADKSDAEVADIERRCLFTKYTICKNVIDQETAGLLLEKELENYSNLVDGREGLNNYWKQFNSLNININNNPQEWKSNLTDPSLAMEFFTQSHSKTPCTYGTKQDVEKLMGIWKKGGSSPRTRKIPCNESRNSQNRIKIENICTGDKLMPDIVHRRPVFQPKQEIYQKEETVKNRQNPFSERVNSSKQNFFYKNEKPVVEKKEDKPEESKFSGFKTARTVLGVQQAKNNNRQIHTNNRQQPVTNRAPVKKSLGGRALNSPYVCPFKEDSPKEEEPVEPTDERLKNIEPKMIELIKNEIMDHGSPISWEDIAGLEHAKRIIKEIVVFPMLRPDIFTGLRRPPKGILLFGPPGTGKTLIGKCIASQSKSTFFSISASSLTSKWVGEGEKMVRALFAVARVEQPSVVFIDEIDSLLCQRSETEHESSRRMKTEFLVQLDGAATGDEDRILVIGATNRPYELDEAARRRLVKRLYVPLPELEARAQIIRNLLKSERHGLVADDVYKIAELADGYSGADMTNLCKEASMGPIRSIPFDQLEAISKEEVRKVTVEDFRDALDAVRPSVSQKDLSVYIEWDRTYGTASIHSRI